MRAVLALALAGVLSIGLALLGAYKLIFDVGDWGWLIGASAGAILYFALSANQRATLAAQAGE